jgi:hypothetical protein
MRIVVNILTHMGETRNSYKSLLGKPQEKRLWEMFAFMG